MSLSMGLVPYRGDADAQCQNLALEQQQVPHIREGDMLSSTALVQHNHDTHRPRLAIQRQEQEAEHAEGEVRYLK